MFRSSELHGGRETSVDLSWIPGSLCALAHCFLWAVFLSGGGHSKGLSHGLRETQSSPCAVLFKSPLACWVPDIRTNSQKETQLFFLHLMLFHQYFERWRFPCCGVETQSLLGGVWRGVHGMGYRPPALPTVLVGKRSQPRQARHLRLT